MRMSNYLNLLLTQRLFEGLIDVALGMFAVCKLVSTLS